MMSYRCGPTAVGSRTSWAGLSAPTISEKAFDRPLSGNYDRIFNAFDRTNAFEYVRTTDKEDRSIGHGEVVVNRRLSSSLESADCALAAHAPSAEDEDFYREKILYSQARQLFPLQEDLADWINKTIGISYLNGENFLDVLDNGVELCQLAAVIHDRARDAIDEGLLVGPVPVIRGRCWQRAARRSFFSRDNTENFITFCRDLGVHDNLLFESDDLVLHNQPRQVILCLLEVARLAARYGLEPPGLVQLEKEIAMEERDAALESSAAWQFRGATPTRSELPSIEEPASSDPNDTQLAVDNADAESTKSEETVASTDSDVPLKPTNELDKRVQLVTRLMQRGCSCGAGRCDRLLKVKKVGEGRYNIAGRNVFIRLLKERHMMVRVGGGWDTLEHFLSRHEPCQVRLVTAGKRLPVSLTPTGNNTVPLTQQTDASTVTPSDTSRTSSPIDSKAGSISPVDRRRPSSAKSEPTRPVTRNANRASLTLPLNSVQTTRIRKQSAPSFSTPVTPTTRTARTPPADLKKSLTSTSLTPKKSRSMSLALAPEKKTFCGTDRLNQAKKTRSGASTPVDNPTFSTTDRINAKKTRSGASTPVETTNQAKKTRSGATTPVDPPARKTRSQSLASTPVEVKKPLPGFVKKTRSMSLAQPLEFRPMNGKSVSVMGMTQAAIEASVRASLLAGGGGGDAPFLHIKAKYRSPPPREVPPR